MDISRGAAAVLGPGAGFARLAEEALRRRARAAERVVEERRAPEHGLDEDGVVQLLARLAQMDSNNFLGNVGAGEREGRIACGLVRRRHFGLGHGMGRSGELGAVQPKAAGSSIICKLTCAMVLDLMRRILGMRSLEAALVVPMATGMTLALVFSALRNRLAPGPERKNKIVMTRIDQMTCIKSIQTCGLIPIVVENIIQEDCVRCDLEAIERILAEDPGVLCVLSTTSCFAPRIPDDVEAIAQICVRKGVSHVINNAYGLQCSKICDAVEKACRIPNGVCAVVQSTDKNFLVPVGGAIVSGPDKKFIEEDVNKTYAGRASISPVVDLFITLLSLGLDGYSKLRRERIELINYFKELITKAVGKFGQRILVSRRNTISFAVTLSLEKTGSVESQVSKEDYNRRMTEFGSMLFTRGVSGARVIPSFEGQSAYGASVDNYPTSYFTVACAIGITKIEIDELCEKIEATYSAWMKMNIKRPLVGGI